MTKMHNGLPKAPAEYDRYAPTGTVACMSGGRVVYVPNQCKPLRYSVALSNAHRANGRTA